MTIKDTPPKLSLGQRRRRKIHRAKTRARADIDLLMGLVMGGHNIIAMVYQDVNMSKGQLREFLDRASKVISNKNNGKPLTEGL